MENNEPKNFNAWNKFKSILHSNISGPQYHREREVWWCYLGLNVGTEMDGKEDEEELFLRPVLILRKFGNLSFWGIPITSTIRNDRFNFELRNRGDCAALSQLRLFSVKRLKTRDDYKPTVTKKDFQKIMIATRDLI